MFKTIPAPQPSPYQQYILSSLQNNNSECFLSIQSGVIFCLVLSLYRSIVSIVNYTFRLTPCKKIQKTDLDPELGSLNRPFFHPLREGRERGRAYNPAILQESQDCRHGPFLFDAHN